MKAVILSNQARSMFVFWQVLIKTMRQKNMEVVCCIPDDDDRFNGDLEKLGVRIVYYSLDRKGLNPYRDLKTFVQLRSVFDREKPDILFATTIKPVIYGCMAASWAKVSGIFATITGLGYAFERDGLVKKIINLISVQLYKMGLKNATGIFFQNGEDMRLFETLGIVPRQAKVFLAAGTGVNTSYFGQAPFPALPPEGPIVFLLIGRLLAAKGIHEYAQAARMVKAKYPQTLFNLLGTPETGRGSIPLDEIRSWEEEYGIVYLGETRDVRPYIAQCHVAVLPSWREGTPTSLLEAMSMGRPLLATDVPGCREVVINGENGYLCAPHDAYALALGMEKFVAEPAIIPAFGQKSRQLAETRFDAHVVANRIMADMERAMTTVGVTRND